MKLLINISYLGDKPTGLGIYAGHCARSAAELFEAELVAPPSYVGPGQRVLEAPPSIALGAGKAAALRRWLWSRRQVRQPGRLVYSPTHHALPIGDAQILTVHDLIALRFPTQHPTQYAFFKLQLPRELARCRAVFTVSETSRDDIHRAYGYPRERIHVVPNGVDTRVFKPGRHPSGQAPFLLVVGAAFPHKNVGELLAMSALWRSDFRLVVASCRGRYREQLAAQCAALGLSKQVELIEYLPFEQLIRLYQTCAAFLYPSRWEGFGIPPLEALACGARVIASDIPAHREVLGASAQFVRLGSVESWREAFESLRQEPTQHMQAEARARVSRYSWQSSAQALALALCAVEPQLSRSHHACTLEASAS